MHRQGKGDPVKVLDLLCPLDHAFEGWFASEEDFVAQCGRHLVQCPMCGSSEVRKALSVPRLNLRGAREPAMARRQPGDDTHSGDTEAPKAERHGHTLEALWLQLARHVMTHTEDVGERFAAEARRMHHREIPERGIRGQATAQETEQLLDEGIAVLPLLIPDAAKNTLQ